MSDESFALEQNSTGVEWVPDQAGYLTAGCGSDGQVHAAANDASWLEVRYDPVDWNSIHNEADLTLGTTDEPTTNQPEETEDESSTEPSTSGILWPPFIVAFIGAALFLIVAQFAVWSLTGQTYLLADVCDLPRRIQH